VESHLGAASLGGRDVPGCNLHMRRLFALAVRSRQTVLFTRFSDSMMHHNTVARACSKPPASAVAPWYVTPRHVNVIPPSTKFLKF
jgi:hypothetical protein